MNLLVYIGFFTLLYACSPPSSPSERIPSSTTPKEDGVLPSIYLAAKKGDLREVSRLIDSGVQVDTVNEDHQTALHVASGHGHLEVVQFLSNHGANINKQDKYGFTPLHWACSSGRTNTITFLKEKADVNKQDQDGMTPLHRAVEGNHLSAVRLLLQTSSVDYLIQDHKGRTPYRLAVDLRLTPIIQHFEKSIPEPQT